MLVNKFYVSAKIDLCEMLFCVQRRKGEIRNFGLSTK